MAKYVCVNMCYVRDSVHYPGVVYEFGPGEFVPRHFEPYNQGQDSTLKKLRSLADERKIPWEPSWGVDALKDLLRIKDLEDEQRSQVEKVDPPKETKKGK